MKALFYRLFALFFNISRTLFSVEGDRVALLSPHNASFNDSLGEIEKEFASRGNFKFLHISHGDFASPIKAALFFTYKAMLLARCKYVFLNDNFMPMAYLNFNKAAVVVQLWHAEGAFKRFGLDIPQTEEIRKREIAANSRLSYVVCSSEGIADVYASAFGVKREQVLSLGSPRADVLLNSTDAQKLRAEFEEKYPQSKNKKIVLYAPTFRDGQSDKEFLSLFDGAAFRDALGEKYFLIVRLHPQLHGEIRPICDADVTDYPSVNELTLLSDVLITDYSSICMDFALLGKPCVFFAPDLDFYTEKRAFYFDYKSGVPGVVAQDMRQLLAAFEGEALVQDSAAFKEKNLSAVDGNSTKRIVDYVLMKK